jgi:O-antigen ligase
VSEAVRDLLHAGRREPAFALYLAALAALGLKWLSPFEPFYERAIWTDVLVAASAGAWLWDLVRTRRRPRIRTFHLGLGMYLAAGALSVAFAVDQGTAALNVLLMTELCVLALLTSEFASDSRRLNAIVLVVAFVALYTAALAVLGLALFYAGLDTSLLDAYGSLTPSDRYARIAGGFESAPLLGSFCIFASAVMAREDTTLPRRLRLATQVALAAVVVVTFSRAMIGFAAAIAIRAGYARRHSPRARLAAATVVIGAVAILAVLTVGRLQVDPATPSSASYDVPGPRNGRWDHIGDGLEAFAERPLTGEGPGALTSEFEGKSFRVHVTPLNVAATMGLPALAAITFLIVTLWRNRRRPTPIATWSGLAGLGIDGLTLDIEHFRNVWVLIGLADADRRPGEPRLRASGRRRAPASASRR